jgi:hypothetical protein
MEKRGQLCDDDGTALFEWLRVFPSAYVHPGLLLRSFPATGRGVYCSTPLARGALLLKIPSAAVLTASAALAELGPLLTAAGEPGADLLRCLEEDDALAIAAALLAEAAGPAPTARARALPPAAALRGVAGAGGWCAGELALLRDGGAAASAGARGAEVSAALCLLRAAAAAAATAGAPLGGALLAVLGAGEGAWRWAVACVASRAFLHGAAMDPLFCCEGTQGMLPVALVPGGDMFNHGGGGGACCDTAWAPDGAYEVRAGARAGAGEELFISYGDRPSRDLLENYGFVPPPGANAAEALVLDASPLALAACGGCSCGCGCGVVGDSDGTGGSALAALLAALPPSGGGARARRAALLGEASGLPPHAVELELPVPRGGGDAPDGGAAAADALRLLRALCLAPGEACAGGAAALEAPLSRANETRAHVALAALLGAAVLDAYGEGAASGGGGGGGGGGSAGCGHKEPGVELSCDGAPLLSARAAGALAARFGAAAAAAAAGADGECSAVTALAAAAADAAGALEAALADISRAEEDVRAGLEGASALRRGGALAPPDTYAVAAPPWAGAEAALGDGGGGGGGAGADRAALAAAYRAVRVQGLRAHAAHAAAMLRVAAGQGRAPPPPLPLSAPAPPRFSGAALCLEVQEPWCGLLLRCEKKTETRGYALPPALVGHPLALLRSPPGGLAAAGLDGGALVGWVVFGAPARYADRAAWAADARAHCVVDGAPGAAAFGWDDAAEKWAWPVVHAQAAAAPPLPVRLAEALRVQRSIFLLPFAAGLALARF